MRRALSSRWRLNRRFDHNHKAVGRYRNQRSTIGDHIVIVSLPSTRSPSASYIGGPGGIFC